MKCPICQHGVTKPGKVSVTLERGDLTLVFKGVPADVCENCGEEFLSEATGRQLLAEAEAAAKAGVTVEVRAFAAA